ncbi:MAG: hypothetical protein WCR08_11760 [Gammaproteobacteria bacterium]
MKYKKMGLGLIAILMAALAFGAMKSHFHISRGQIIINPDIYASYI